MIISISIGSTSATARIINNNDAANYEDNNYSAMTAATRQRRLGLGEEVFFDEMLEDGICIILIHPIAEVVNSGFKTSYASRVRT